MIILTSRSEPVYYPESIYMYFVNRNQSFSGDYLFVFDKVLDILPVVHQSSLLTSAQCGQGPSTHKQFNKG